MSDIKLRQLVRRTDVERDELVYGPAVVIAMDGDCGWIRYNTEQVRYRSVDLHTLEPVHPELADDADTPVDEVALDIPMHARNELARHHQETEVNDPTGTVARSVLELCSVISSQGHTGGRLAEVLGLFNHLVARLPLTPLTGEDNEWFNPMPDDPAAVMLVNKRCARVLKMPDGTVFDTQGIAVRQPEGHTVFNQHSWQRVESWPYTPTTLVLDAHLVEELSKEQPNEPAA